MVAVAHPYMRRLARPLALSLALFSLLFLLQVTPHLHANGQDEATCCLCQVAHLGATPAVAAPSLSEPLVCFGSIPTLSVEAIAEFFFGNSPSRAPPAVNAQ